MATLGVAASWHEVAGRLADRLTHHIDGVPAAAQTQNGLTV
jgi:lipoyl(octanoyl) transferase